MTITVFKGHTDACRHVPAHTQKLVGARTHACTHTVLQVPFHMYSQPNTPSLKHSDVHESYFVLHFSHRR